MRSVVVAAKLSNEDVSSLFEQGSPGFAKHGLQPFLVIVMPICVQGPSELIARNLHGAVSKYPRSFVVGDEHWLIASSALDDVGQVLDTQQRSASPLETIDHDDTFGTYASNLICQTANHTLVVSVRDVGYLVQQIETQVLA